MKKIIALVLVIVVLATSTAVVFAAQSVNIGDLINDTGKWKGNAKAKFEIKDGVLNITGVDNSTMGYVGKKFGDEVFNMIANINLDAEGHWPTFVLRSTDPTKELWDPINLYLVVVKNNQIEIQKWQGGAQIFMEIFSTTVFKSKKDTNLQLSAVNVDNGVKITVAVDGKTYAEYTDTKNPIKDSGYFGVIPWSSTSLSLKGIANSEAVADDASSSASNSDSEAVADDASSSTSNSENPKTGDASVLVYAFSACTALMGAAVVKKLRK